MKKLVCESLEELRLNETYESSKELEMVAKFITNNREYLIKPMKLKDFFQKIDLDKDFPILKNFLKSEIAIVFQNSKYPMFSYPPYFKEEDLANEKDFPYLNEKDYPWGIVIINDQIDAVLHEFQHAYDYFRSDRKITRDKKVLMLQKKIKQGKSMEDDNQLKRYIRIKPEQSSYFVESMKLMKGYVENYPDKPWGDFKYALEKFTYTYPEWKKLTPKDKKNLTRKFFQYWQKYLDEK